MSFARVFAPPFFCEWVPIARGVLLFPRCTHGDASAGGVEGAGQATRTASPEALRLNTLGVAYMNQQKSAEAQKYFEQALGG